mgnify:FL=1|tara:strand:+ start:1076 stop:1891 length:816 start_codon:yes stop_codon:yes gene_type:complete
MENNFRLDNKGNGQIFSIKEHICTKNSIYQKISILDLHLLGRVLVLDDIIQLSELDCDVYHESFAHIPMLYSKDSKKVLILGGGDGILAKELLKYKNLSIDLVDIDGEVCEISKKYLYDLNNGALLDDRVKVHNKDAFDFCNTADEKTYDVIFGDITDPHPNSPSASLLSDQAVDAYKRVLTDDGVIAFQTDNVQVAPDHIADTEAKLNRHFKNINCFSIVAITLGGLFSFVCATNGKNDRKKLQVPTKWLNEKKVKISLSLNNYSKQKDV